MAGARPADFIFCGTFLTSAANTYKKYCVSLTRGTFQGGDLLAEYLNFEGLKVVPIPFGALSHRRTVFSADHSLVVLGIVPPGTDATDLLRRLQAESEAGVLLMIAGGEDLDGIIGLQPTADNCSPTPFSSRELVARLSALVRGL